MSAEAVGRAARDSDEALVSAMARGDRAALAAVYDRFAPLLGAVARRILGDARESEDLVHDVLLEAWRRSGDFDGSRSSVRSWLLLTLRSRALDRVRSAGHARVVHDEAPLALLARAPEAEAAVDAGRLRRALTRLPPAQREVLELAYYDGLSSTEIAARLAVPVGTVKSRTAAAFAKLREDLAGEAA